MKVHSEEYKGFTVELHALDEHLTLDQIFDTPEDIYETGKSLDRGDLFLFCAEVKVLKNGIDLASEYLGACIYKDYADFVTANDYYEDMRETAIAEAKEVIKSLVEGE